MIHTGYVEKKYLKDKNALIGKVWLLVKCLFLLMHWMSFCQCIGQVNQNIDIDRQVYMM